MFRFFEFDDVLAQLSLDKLLDLSKHILLLHKLTGVTRSYKQLPQSMEAQASRGRGEPIIVGFGRG